MLGEYSASRDLIASDRRQVATFERPDGTSVRVFYVLAAFESRVILAPRNGFQARFSAPGVRRLERAAALAAERSLASLSR